MHKDSACAIVLGAFDGVHLGHASIIKKTVDEAKKRSLRSAAYTFNNLPKSKMQNISSIQILKSDDKIELIKSLGIEEIYSMDFDEKLIKTTREEFIERLIIEYKVKLIIIGKDFKFGFKALGNAEWLKSIKNIYDFELIVEEFVNFDGSKISSSDIRRFLQAGKMEKASKLLGRNHFLKGKVVHGRKVGRSIGFPTANMEVSPEMTLIAEGVYYTKANIDGKVYDSISNVGVVPSFENVAFSVEAHIINFNSDIYGKTIKLEFIRKIRNQIKFECKDDIAKQIKKDIESLNL